MQLDRLTLGRMAKELGFVRDTLEKVCRLADVLKFMESDELLSEAIALKGGTAINLTIFDLPRLSVDIDLDYCRSIDREEMLADRNIITDKISKYMNANGYTLSSKSKYKGCLDIFYPTTDPVEFYSSIKRIKQIPVKRILPGLHQLDIESSLIDEIEAGFSGLEEKGLLKQGAGIFDFGDFQIHI